MAEPVFLVRGRGGAKMSSQITSHHSRHAVEAPARAAGSALRKLPRRVLAAFDRAVDALLFWQRVDHGIRRLAALSDAELKRRGLERGEIVASVYAASMRERERLR
jgi:hypothetical protein